MNITLEAIRQATEIIAIGLSSGKKPSMRYLQPLVAAYITNTDGVRSAAQTMATQFGIIIVSVSDEGVVLTISPERDSIFMPKRNDLLKEQGVDARLIRGICNAAILACAFERQQALLSEAVQTVTVDEAYDLLTRSAAALASTDPEPTSPIRGLTEAARIVERIKADSFKEKSEKPRKATLRGRLIEAFNSFVEQGQMIKDSDDEGGTYKTLSNLRKVLAFEGAIAAVEAVREAVKKSNTLQNKEEASHA
jgi:hypothetical protein